MSFDFVHTESRPYEKRQNRKSLLIAVSCCNKFKKEQSVAFLHCGILQPNSMNSIGFEQSCFSTLNSESNMLGFGDNNFKIP